MFVDTWEGALLIWGPGTAAPLAAPPSRTGPGNKAQQSQQWMEMKPWSGTLECISALEALSGDSPACISPSEHLNSRKHTHIRAAESGSSIH